MEDDFSSAWDVPRPAVRLWLSLALGLLGAFLLPAQDFAPHTFDNFQRVALIAWIVAAFVSVLLLHRVEKAKVPMGICAIMGLALVLSLVLPRVVGRQRSPEGQGLVGFAGFCSILLVLVLGASIVWLRFRGKAKRTSWLEALLRGPAIALAAPLLLWASRPIARGGSSSRMDALSRAVFVLFPFALAAGFVLLFVRVPFAYREVASRLGLVFLSLSVWTWLGCAVLFVLSPWPEYPRMSRTDHVTTARKIVSLAAIAFLVMALVRLVVLSGGMMALFLSHPPYIWVWVGCMLIILLSPWPEYPPIPRLGALPEARKVGPLGTALFLAMGLVALGSAAYRPFLRIVISGELFASGFNRSHIGAALGRGFLVFAYFTALVFPYVAIARWMGDRRTRLGYWAFAVPTIALCLLPLGILAVPFYWLIQYIGAMGYTRVRIYGVAYGLVGYVVVLVFLLWAVWAPNKTRDAVKRVRAESDSGQDCGAWKGISVSFSILQRKVECINDGESSQGESR